MKNRWAWIVGAAALTVVLAPLPGTGAAEPGASPAFDRFKALAGEWVSAEDGPMVKKGDLVARYHLTGGGSAVVEDLFPGTDHQMTTVYHRDGSDLVLTHYCMTGNQPRMRAKPTTGSTVAFAFDGGTNVDPKKDHHMHEATFEFLSADEIRSTWVGHQDGKPGMVVKVHLVRKAS